MPDTRTDRPSLSPDARLRRPLEDIRILAFEQYGAGPWGSLHLADLGAEVIKIEDPVSDGDVGRYVPPYNEGEDSLFYEALNRNKSSISLDLRSEAGQQVFRRLVAESDAVYSNLRGDVPAKIGLTYADLKEINPAIVCCSLSGFGMTGPRAKGPGYDYMLQGYAGWMSVTGEPGGPPTKTGLSLVDFTGGYVAALSMMIGIHAARRDGIGMDCDVSLFDTAVTMLNYPAAWHLNADYNPSRSRHSAHPSLVPFQNFEASDGWFVVACAKEKFWRHLVSAAGWDDLGEDQRFSDFTSRNDNREQLLPILEERFSARTVADWLDVLGSAGVPVAPVNSVADALADEHTAARELIVETVHPRFGTLKTLASPVRVGKVDHSSFSPGPARHENAQHILTTIAGYSDDVITGFARSGAFGDSFAEPAPTQTKTI